MRASKREATGGRRVTVDLITCPKMKKGNGGEKNMTTYRKIRFRRNQGGVCSLRNPKTENVSKEKGGKVKLLRKEGIFWKGNGTLCPMTVRNGKVVQVVPGGKEGVRVEKSI